MYLYLWLTCRWFVVNCLFPDPMSVSSWWLTANLWSRDQCFRKATLLAMRHIQTVLVPFGAISFFCLVMTGRAFTQEGDHHPQDIRIEHSVTAAFKTCHWTGVCKTEHFPLHYLRLRELLIDAKTDAFLLLPAEWFCVRTCNEVEVMCVQPEQTQKEIEGFC